MDHHCKLLLGPSIIKCVRTSILVVSTHFVLAEGIFDSVNNETDKREGSKDKMKLRKSSVRKSLHAHAFAMLSI